LKLLEEQLGGGGQPLFDTTAEHVFKWENVKYGEAMFNIFIIQGAFKRRSKYEEVTN
jgi:hypothetical protein